MATKKSKEVQVIKGSHLTVTVHPDGRRELVWDDEALARDVKKAIDDYTNKTTANPTRTRATRKKKD